MGREEITARLAGGRYELIDTLGRGGMGRVWRGRDAVLGRDVAVKEVILPEAPSEEQRDSIQTRALREARASARLSHPGVVTVYDVVREEGRLFIVMELVAGRSLSERVREEGPLPPEEAARVGAAVADILALAHSEGIVHRDVKPGNVLLTEAGEVKLADFGIASVRDETSITVSGQVFGSPQYMAPEQARGDRSGPPTDLWGLGATLYFAVEGRAPFEAEHPLAVLTSVLHQDPETPRRAGPLAPVISALLRKEPAERPSAEEAARMLRGAGQAPVPEAAPHDMAAEDTGTLEPVEEPPPTPVPGPAPRKRTPGWVWAASLTALAVLGFLAAYLLLRPTPESPARAPGRASPAESPAEAAVPAGWETYRDESTGWEVAYPPSWEIQPQDESMIDFVDPETGTYLRVDWGDDPDPSPVGNWNALAKSFAESHENYQEITIEPTQFKGHKAAIWEFTFTEGGADLHALDLGFITEDYGFALFFQTHAEDWEGSQETFEAMKASFRVPR